jgi:hypothetical protein
LRSIAFAIGVRLQLTLSPNVDLRGREKWKRKISNGEQMETGEGKANVSIIVALGCTDDRARPQGSFRLSSRMAMAGSGLQSRNIPKLADQVTLGSDVEPTLPQ